MTGRFSLEAANHPISSETILSIPGAAQTVEGYRGIVAGKAHIPLPGNYEVRAYLYTDAEYAQPDATVGVVQPDGSWRFSAVVVDTDFKGTWHFRLYNANTGIEIGKSWPRPEIYVNLEIRYYLETDSRYLQATELARAAGEFVFTANNNPGRKIFQLVNSTTGEVLAEDYRPPHTGLIRSYEYLSSFGVAISDCQQPETNGNGLLKGLSQAQVKNGEFAGVSPSSAEQNNPTNVDKTYHIGGNAVILCAITRYIKAYGDVNGAKATIAAGS